MKYCENCGAEINENAIICLKCGCAAEPAKIQVKNTAYNSVSSSAIDTQLDTTVVDSDGIIVLLAILIPLFGFIYWGVTVKEREDVAQCCAIGAGIGCVMWLLFWLCKKVLGVLSLSFLFM